MWTSKEKDAVWKKWCDDVHLDDIVRAERLATLAVELVQARGGTMTEDALTTLYADMARWWEQEDVDRIAGHIIAQGAQVATLQAKVEELETALASAPRPFAIRAADALADEVAALVKRGVLHTRTPVTDALEDYRDPPSTPRADRLASLEHERDSFHAEVERLKAEAQGALNGLLVVTEVLTDDPKEPAINAARRVAAERDALRAEVERLKAALEDTKDRLRIAATDSEMVESRLAAIEERANDTQAILDRALDGILGVVAWVCNGARKEYDGPGPEDMLEGDAPQEAQDLVEVVTLKTGMVGGPQKTEVLSVRYPCSATCTHDDARTPGHPERVRQQSEAVITATHANAGHPDALPEGPLEVVEPAFISGHEQGAEAMRAACWEAVQALLQSYGMQWSNWSNVLKAAIEGAAP
jgi:hypothetical protein